MSDWKTLTAEIESRNEAIAAEIEQESIILANLGQSVHGSGLVEGNIVDKVIGEIHKLEDALRRILADEDKRVAILEETKSLKVELRNMKNRELPLLEELGRTAWEVWKSGHQINDGMEEALDDLVKAEERVHTAEDALHRNENGIGGKSANILSRGKAFLLAGRRKTATVALDRLWGRAGGRIRDMIAAELFVDTPAAAPSMALKALSARREEIAAMEMSMTEKNDALDAALEEMPGKGGARKRVAWIEDSLETRRTELDDAFKVLGREWLDVNGGKKADSGVEKRRLEWVEINKKIQLLNDEQNALKAHLDIIDSETLRDNKAGQVSRLEAEIKSRQSELKELKKELSAIEKKLAIQKEKLPPQTWK
jgi:hypothetical protein